MHALQLADVKGSFPGPQRDITSAAYEQRQSIFRPPPILNSPYGYPARHWELDDQGQPTQKIIENRRQAESITPIPKPKKRTGSDQQSSLLFDE